MTNLSDFGRVNIDVDDFRTFSEALDVTGYPIIKTGTEGYQEVGFLQSSYSWNRSVHSRHTQMLRVRVWESTSGHQGRGDRSVK